MTNQEPNSSITPSAPPKEKPATIVTQDDAELLAKARGFVKRLRFMIVNGKRLTDNEIWALAQYAAATGLDPFSQECYYIPEVGPAPGIKGWRRKAEEQLEYEATLAFQQDKHFTGFNYWLESRPATRQEANFEEGVDIAIYVTLRDNLSNHIWRKSILDTAKELAGIGVKEAYEEAKKLVGPEPVWTGIGIVFGDEIFSRNGKPEKFTREERAAKRAEKLAIQKRFPRINLPEPESGGKVIELDASELKIAMDEPAPALDDGIQQAPTPEDVSTQAPWEPGEVVPTKTVQQSIEELGFSQDK
ncbi:MAG: recombinase RecT [Sphaerochaeta sp.]|jgi:hypothetical protein|nr:recombinase RecT [Sphaerochaeta sp.]